MTAGANTGLHRRPYPPAPLQQAPEQVGAAVNPAA
jgi:hypothetical protein